MNPRTTACICLSNRKPTKRSHEETELRYQEYNETLGLVSAGLASEFSHKAVHSGYKLPSTKSWLLKFDRSVLSFGNSQHTRPAW